MNYVWYLLDDCFNGVVYVVRITELDLFPICMTYAAPSENYTSLAFWLGQDAEGIN